MNLGRMMNHTKTVRDEVYGIGTSYWPLFTWLWIFLCCCGCCPPPDRSITFDKVQACGRRDRAVDCFALCTGFQTCLS